MASGAKVAWNQPRKPRWPQLWMRGSYQYTWSYELSIGCGVVSAFVSEGESLMTSSTLRAIRVEAGLTRTAVRVGGLR